jgi:hypothetical protein
MAAAQEAIHARWKQYEALALEHASNGKPAREAVPA